MRKTISLAALTAVLGGAALAQDPVELRMLWYSDGVEGEVMADLLERFEEENPDIDVVLDNVAYQVVQEQLPIQLASGQGPDVARVASTLKSDAQHWLDLRPYLTDEQVAYWQENFGNRLDWMRPDGSDAIPGFLTQLTMVGGFANATLFEQAGVDLPGEGATWDEWVAASAEVMESQGTAAAFAIDRTGHRISGPIASYGGNYIGEDGMPAPIDDGTMAFLTKLVEWTDAGLMLPEVWVSAAGTTYRSGADDFINAQIPLLYSGSWQVANLSTKIGDAFDWVAIGSPCGTEGCSGLAGGAGLVAIRYTEHPEEVARLMDWLASEEIVREFSERTLFLPAHAGIVEAGGLTFQSEDPNVPPALDRFVQASGETLPMADALPAWKWANAYYGALVTRVSQVMAGEITLDEARGLMDRDIADAVENASQ
ncbi:ABC transporter substrate-binding protein [Wenxinia marina]|uniref:Carbohydrate ABC transporter substrate-binding protein, CUT1 family n=1 Tax=Wenxinia marina DSM 24838 TaxID=1123501 RepID=A0A0D0Q5N4_9RHOB|nr:ABC transporter substrate-binding protein [Wenxinia marina]KIQ69779.1 carbohydrate ABC transporter substrate-binding protein, CUT1 family [Wenxinia marina DSM 24838]GGL61122.1 sugar ABC transporter substrate-binding protein [Wenxinia marina]